MDPDLSERRLVLQELLEGLVGPQSYSGTKAHFQPPNGKVMSYPCIVYKRDGAVTQYADNNPHRYTQRYQVTVIDRDPDSPIPGRVAMLPLCRFDRHYTADDLNHDVYNLFF